MTSLGPIDSFLAQTLQGDAVFPTGMDPELVADRVLYHGIASLLIGLGIVDWPEKLRDRVRLQAMSQAMWEMQHKIVLTGLLDALTDAGVKTVILKGTAIAYCYYSNPAYRTRGDSDLLIDPGSLSTARQVLRNQGFKPFYDFDADEDERKQEPWSISMIDGSQHEIDLHWSVLNSPLLDGVLPVKMALAESVALPPLGPECSMLPTHLALLHACVHRAIHVTSPYFVDGLVRYGGDRLIWLKDIDLMVRALDRAESVAFEGIAAKVGVGKICAQALLSAHKLLGAPLDRDLYARLNRSPAGPAGRYLSQMHQGSRALEDLKSVQGYRGKLRYLAARLFPPAAFMRTKYSDKAGWPLTLLYLHRIFGFLRSRPRQTR